MGAAWFFILVFAAVGCFVLGAIVLATVPRFRFTFSNLCVFFLGAIVGMIALSMLVMRPLAGLGWLSKMNMQQANSFAGWSFFIEALIGGTGFVWLKTWLSKPRSD
jgi:hypothetical protein